MKIFIVYGTDYDSRTGFDISGIFETRYDALNWAKSEGNGQLILETTTGPIEWNKMEHSYDGIWE